MAEPTQYTFAHKELVEILVKHLGITEGRWQLLLNFGLGAGNVGPDEQHLDPVGMIVVNKIGIQKIEDQSQPSTNLVFEAQKPAD